MMKRVLSVVVLVSFVMLSGARPAAAATDAEKASKVKAGIARLGTGEDARIDVRLRDERRVSGYVSAASETAFEVKDLRTGATTSVAYDDVSRVKGHNLALSTKIAIGAAVGVAVVLLIFAAVYANNEGGL